MKIKLFYLLSTFGFKLFCNDILTFKEIKNFQGEEGRGQLVKPFLKLLSDIFKPDVFFETGTYLGDTTSNASEYFKEIHTIELSNELYNKAILRFKKNNNIYLYNGDSGLEMFKILPSLNDKKILFWLDAHWSGGETAKGDSNCPASNEFMAIKESSLKDSIILIDDLRFFQIDEIQSIISKEYSTAGGFPTIKNLYHEIKKLNSNYKIIIYGDTLIAYLDENVKISPVIKGMTTSRLYDELDNNFDDINKILEAESLIAYEATSEEKYGIKRLYEHFKEPVLFVRHFKIWQGLILYGEKDYLNAIKVFEENLEEEDFIPWRVYYYIAKCALKLGDFNKVTNALDKLKKINGHAYQYVMEDFDFFQKIKSDNSRIQVAERIHGIILYESFKLNDYIEILGKQILEYRDKNYWTPLIFAINYENNNVYPKVTKKLIELGSNVNALSLDNTTPLMYAVRQGNINKVKLLLENDVQINTQDNFGKSALDMAKERGFIEIEELIKSYIK